jgi:long-chain acyl-CoA synthetase
MGDKTLPKVFQDRVKKYGNRVALREKDLGIWKDISWNDYSNYVKQVSYSLWVLGCRKGDHIAIIGGNCPEWLYIDLGAQSIGAICNGVYTTDSASQIKYILEHSEVKYFFVEDEEQLDKALSIRNDVPMLVKVIYWDNKGLKDFRDPDVLYFEDFLKIGLQEAKRNTELFDQNVLEGKADDIAIIVYTSGTTGLAKGVMLSHKNLLSASEALYKAHQVYDTDQLLSFLPLCHIGERTWSFTHAINYGYTVNFAESPETVSQDIREIAPTIFFAVPRIWEKFYASIVLLINDLTKLGKLSYKIAMNIAYRVGRKTLNQELVPLKLKILYKLFDFLVYNNTRKMLGLQRCHFIFSGAAPVSPDLLFFFYSLGLKMREIYGQTEMTGSISIHQGDDIKLGTVGKPVPGVEVKISHDGEILVRGQGVFKGYIKDELLTNSTIKNGWLHTGDIGKVDEKGNLIVTDRKKDIIITSGGKNITPQYIENKLKFSPYINDAIVIGDRRKYLTTLIMIDDENVVKYAQDLKIPFTTYSSLTKSEEVMQLIKKEVDKVNKELAQVEQIKKFWLIDVMLTAEDLELTPTMKLKRKYIEERFAEQINSMY